MTFSRGHVLLASALGLLLAGAPTPVLAGPGRGASLAPGATAAPVAAVDAALADIPASGCRDQVREQLIRGQRGDDSCEGTRNAATQALARHRAGRFGVVELRRVQLTGIRLVLSVATRCRAWPLRSGGRLVMRTDDAIRAGCRLDRYRGPVQLFVVSREGERTRAITLETDADGRADLEFGLVDRALREGSHAGLDAHARLEIGAGAWAGAIDLARLRRLVADWHFEWVRRGRGAPALFVARHPGHERGGAARALAVEATLSRQERDYLAVSRGQLAAEAFLRRHAWSPYRRSVANIAGRPAHPRDGAPAAP